MRKGEVFIAIGVTLIMFANLVRMDELRDQNQEIKTELAETREELRVLKWTNEQQLMRDEGIKYQEEDEGK